MRTSGKGTVISESAAPANVAIGALAGTTRVAFAVTVPGARTTDFPVLRLNAPLEVGLAVESVEVTAANTVTVRIYNKTAGALPAAAFTMDAMCLPSDLN
jgi:hypothetical protein